MRRTSGCAARSRSASTEVIADFGQARGTNTATNLPNDPLFSHHYGRIILMRETS